MRISDWSSDVCSSDLFARIARLGNVIVGAELEADDAVDVFTARSQHHDRNTLTGAQLFEHAKAVGLRHHHVEDQHVVDTALGVRSEERRVGKECVSTFGSWGSRTT